MKLKSLLLFVPMMLILSVSCQKEKSEDLPDIVDLPISEKNIYNVTTSDNSVYTSINNTLKEILIIIPFKSNLTVNNLQIDLSISANATCNMIQGTAYDLTNPFNLIITAEDGSTVTYVITAFKCEGDKVAVILNDTQKDIIPLYRQDAFFNNVNSVLEKADNKGVNIYYIMLASLKGTSKWDLPDQLNYRAGEYIDKPNVVDAFTVKSFLLKLLKDKIGKVYIMGVSSMGCVKGTCEGAINHKFEVYLVSDAHSEPSDYPGGSRPETAIDQCNNTFESTTNITLITASEVTF